MNKNNKNELEGKFKIELKNAETGELIEKREYKNIITNGYLNLVKSLINPYSIQLATNPKEIMKNYPFRKGFGGMLMWDQYCPEQQDTIYINNVLNHNTCHAGGEYAGSDETRGTLLTPQCEYTDEYIKMVWEFAAGKGNGTHRSITLTSEQGGNVGVNNKILVDNVIVDSGNKLDTYIPFYRIPSLYNELSGESPIWINADGNSGSLGMSPDMKYIYRLRGFTDYITVNNFYIDRYELIDYSNLKANGYLYSHQLNVGLQKRNSIPVNLTSADIYSWRWGVNIFKKELLVYDAKIRLLRFINLDTGEIKRSITLGGDKQVGNSQYTSYKIAQIGDWLYVIGNATPVNGILNMDRYHATSGNYIDTIYTPFHIFNTTGYAASVFNFSESEIYIKFGSYGYLYDGEKLSGYFSTKDTVMQKTDYYPLLVGDNSETRIDNRYITTVHNFDAPIIKDTTMTMTVTYMIKHVDPE